MLVSGHLTSPTLYGIFVPKGSDLRPVSLSFSPLLKIKFRFSSDIIFLISCADCKILLLLLLLLQLSLKFIILMIFHNLN